jgi:hypothetical protein
MTLRRILAFALVSTILLMNHDGSADVPLPVTVRVVGQGAIRMRVAEGHAAPCDASSNQMRFDGWIDAGSSAVFVADSDCVCVEHTYGAFREAQWSIARVACRAIPWRSHRRPDNAITIEVSTDTP